MNLTTLTPGGITFVLSSGAIAGLIAKWLLCDDDEPDPALSLERLPESRVREVDDVCSQEQREREQIEALTGDSRIVL